MNPQKKNIVRYVSSHINLLSIITMTKMWIWLLGFGYIMLQGIHPPSRWMQPNTYIGSIMALSVEGVKHGTVHDLIFNLSGVERVGAWGYFYPCRKHTVNKEKLQMKRKDSTCHSLSVLTVGVMGLLDYFLAFMKIKGLYVHTFYKAYVLSNSALCLNSMEYLAAIDHWFPAIAL